MAFKSAVDPEPFGLSTANCPEESSLLIRLGLGIDSRSGLALGLGLVRVIVLG